MARVVFGDINLQGVDDILTADQIRTNLAGMYPSITHATVAETMVDGVKVFTFTPKAADKG